MSKQQNQRNDEFFSPAVEFYSARVFWDDLSKNINPTEDTPRWSVTKKLVKENKVDMSLVISSGYHPHKLPIQIAWQTSKVGTFGTLYSAFLGAFDISILAQKTLGLSYQTANSVLLHSGLALCAMVTTFLYFDTIKKAKRKSLHNSTRRRQNYSATL